MPWSQAEDRSFTRIMGINYGASSCDFNPGSLRRWVDITQQLAKNTYLSQDQTVGSKGKEFFLALNQ